MRHHLRIEAAPRQLNLPGQAHILCDCGWTGVWLSASTNEKGREEPGWLERHMNDVLAPLHPEGEEVDDGA